MRICVISMIWEPVDLIRRFIAYHQNIGITDFILFIDKDDGRISEELSITDGVTAIACNEQFANSIGMDLSLRLSEQQRHLMDHGLKIARQKDIDWITHIDFDELIFPRGDLRAILSSLDGNLYAYRLYEAIPNSCDDTGPYDADTFRCYWDARRRIKLANFLTLGRVAFKGRYFRAHIHSKSIVRISDNVIRLNIHAPELKIQESRIITDKLVLLHFDSLSTSQWLRKWSEPKKLKGIEIFGRKRQLIGKIANMANGRTKRFQDRYFRRLFMTGPYSRFILRHLNLLDKIVIPKAAFLFQQTESENKPA